MQTLSAKLKSISFARNCESRKPMIDPEKWKLIKWIFPCAALMAACLSHIYKVRNMLLILIIKKRKNISKSLIKYSIIIK